MDSIKDIAIAKITEILATSHLLEPKLDLWKVILYTAGYSDFYEDKGPYLQCTTRVEDWNTYYEHNIRSFSALLEIFHDIMDEEKVINKVLDVISRKLEYTNIFSDDLDKIRTNSMKDEEKNQLLKNNVKREFAELRRNCNILGLDFCYINGELRCIAFSGSDDLPDKISIIYSWLEDKKMGEHYLNALKEYGNGNPVACISHCRSLITGVFSTQKDEQRKWVDGLKKACKDDKNINNVQTNLIHTIKYCENDQDVNNRYQYPRYNLIYKLYSLTCALGAHSTEGNITADGVDFEVSDYADALWTLRMTENVLIWLIEKE